MSRDLPSHELVLFNGLKTKFRPEDIAGRYLTLAQNIDGYGNVIPSDSGVDSPDGTATGNFLAVGRIPGSLRVSDAHTAQPVDSIHQFEFTDYDIIRKRHQLSFSAGEMYRINSPTSKTQITTKRLFTETMRAVTMLDRIHFTSPKQNPYDLTAGTPTGGIKYDGTKITNWGVEQPGAEVIIKEEVRRHVNWSGGPDICVSSTQTVTKNRNAAVQMDKTGTSQATGYIERTGLTLDLSDAGQDTALVWLFLPSEVLAKLATTVHPSPSAVDIEIGNAGLTDSYHIVFTVGQLQPGWNLLSLLIAEPFPASHTDGAGATLSSIDTLRLGLNFKDSSQTQIGIVWNAFYVNPEGALTANAVGANKAPDGTYQYRVTFVTEFGVESNAGPVSIAVTANNQSLDLTNIPTSTDTQVVSRRIYRDIAGDAIFRFVTEILDNSTTSLTGDDGDNTSDGALGTAQPPIAGDTHFDNSPPPAMYDTVVWNNRVIGIVGGNQFTLAISEPAKPEQFRLIDQLQLEEELKAIETHALGLMIYASDKLFLMTGDGITVPFRIDEVSNQIGANGWRSVVQVKGINIVHRESEVFLVANPSDPWLLNADVLDLFQKLDPGKIADQSFMIHDRSRYRIIFFNPTGLNARVKEALVYQYGTRGIKEVSGFGTGTDPMDLRNGVWFTMRLPDVATPNEMNPKDAELMERTADRPELWVAGGELGGFIYWYGHPEETTWKDALGGALPIDVQFKCAAVPIGSGKGGRGLPRYLKVNSETVDTAGAVTWTITVEVLSDADANVIGTKSFTLNTGGTPVKKSQIVPIPRMGVRGEWCTVKFAHNSASESSSFIRSVELFYQTRGDFRGPRTK